MAIQCAYNLDPSVHWNATGERIVGSQCVSSGLPMAFQLCSGVFQLCKLTLDGHWIASISQCSSSGIPVYLCLQWSSSVFQLCKLTLDRHWVTTVCYHQPVWCQWHPSVLVAPVVFLYGISVYWQNLVCRSLGQLTSQHATPYVYGSYGESCLS